MLELLTEPAAEVMTSADPILRAQLRLEEGETEEDALIDALAVSARMHVERYARIGLLPQTWRLTLGYWPACALAFPRAPVRSVEAVRYTQSDGSQAVLDPADYELTKAGPTAGLAPAFGKSWPAIPHRGRVEIDFSLGYDDAAAIPAPIKQAIRLEVAHLFANREAVAQGGLAPIPLGVADLLAPYRLFV
ncbi:head-tail connector protein [Mameliella alba]|uniref:GTA protein ORFG06 n=1 Tax=Mameliella alba TaxID=561184 RepID=A0A0B3SL13_9RHOB|nr:head-tail connector protein [Mameliella alba]KHQ51249.1 GTA protein ORFG06 [Mameliella alba]MBY6121818.1 head-tail connector protein [Mameliella alba]OWV41891.1 hypothetical protein CDZ96_24445 [Mameliella alba]PTR35548.1 putative phiE125 gp8 family phage protein [Mameliella alba]SDE20334.1 phage conserved hypothetical protein, phiE125 gp8 family [Mameliella alba]